MEEIHKGVCFINMEICTNEVTWGGSGGKSHHLVDIEHAFAREPSTFSAAFVASPWRVCRKLVVKTMISRQRTYLKVKKVS